VQRNVLRQDPDGTCRLVAGEETETIRCGLVFPSIGYQVQPLKGVPFDAAAGTVEHRRGQVLDRGVAVPGLFVTGWAKRGPHGVIGANKPDAQETVRCLLEAQKAGLLPSPTAVDDLAVTLVTEGVDCVSYADWQLLDALEVEAGRPEGRPRRKFTDFDSMLTALANSDRAEEELAVGEC
jgi:ferredoxin--NADP+ reductase